MKSSLKLKLTLSYVLISLFLVLSLLFTARTLINSQFQNYVKETHQNNINEIVTQITTAYGSDGTPPSSQLFQSIGEAALQRGFILKVENNGKSVWDMENMNPQECDQTLKNMANTMKSIYPNFNGQYVEQSYDIQKGGKYYGTITLGYYGPFYYTSTDVQFLNVLNQVFLVGAGIALVIAILLGLYMARRITDPLKKVVAHTERIAQGNYSDLIGFKSNMNEVDELIHSVNSLSNTLRTQFSLRKRRAQDYAHEFRTPLATLRSNLEAMIDGIWTTDKQRLESLNEEVLRLTRMVDSLDTLVEIEDENMVLNKTTFDLLDFSRKLVMNFDSDLLKKRLSLTVEGSKCMLKADKDKIGQVILNLISNAIRYTNENGAIKVKVEDKGSRAELSVSDNGIGIDKDDLPYIFEHMYRTDQSRAAATGGSGIGLTISKAIVNAHGGAIKVESEANKGSTFTVILPKKI